MSNMNNYLFVNLDVTNIELSWLFPKTSDYLISNIIDVSAVKFNDQFLSLQLPNAREGGFEAQIIVRNVSTTDANQGSFYLVDYTGNNILGDYTAIIPGDVYLIYLTDISNAAGIWKTVKLTNGTTAINNFTIASNNNSLTINGGEVTTTGQTVDVSLNNSLKQILDVKDKGYLVIDATTNPSNFFTRSFTGDDNITIVNPNGIANTNTQITLNQQIQNITSIKVSNINISGNTIQQTPDQNLNLTTTGDGVLNLNEIIIDTNGNLTVPGQIISSNVNVGTGIFYETSAPFGTDSQIVILRKPAIVNTIEGVNGVYTVTFTQTLNNYGVQITPLANPDSPITIVRASNFNLNSFMLYNQDMLGNYLPLTAGVTFTIV